MYANRLYGSTAVDFAIASARECFRPIGIVSVPSTLTQCGVGVVGRPQRGVSFTGDWTLGFSQYNGNTPCFGPS